MERAALLSVMGLSEKECASPPGNETNREERRGDLL